MQSYKHFTTEERACLAEYVRSGKRPSEIRRLLNRNRSSVLRELSRSSCRDGCYNPMEATNRYRRRRKKSMRKPRLYPGIELFAFVCEKLEATWSPEEIVLEWKRLHLGERLSPWTLYRAVHKGFLPGIAPRTHLRRRGKQKYGVRSKFNAIQPERTIHDRPEIVERRGRIGDWEGDTLCGGKGKGSLVTCVDRKSRYLTASLLSDHQAQRVTQAMSLALKNLPVQSLTLDNGAEFADFRNMEAQLGAPVYFADPRSPWQRGTNENMNGRLRFFFPRCSDFRSITQHQLDEVIDRINSRPRKCLGGLSPKQYFADCCT